VAGDSLTIPEEPKGLAFPEGCWTPAAGLAGGGVVGR
jgi:hypothetical protein